MSNKIAPKSIPYKERLIFALDVSSSDEAKRLVNLFGDTIHFYKLGLELFVSGDYFALTEWLHEKGKKIFVDLKFFDVPETVSAAVRQLKDRHATFVTVHGNESILEAAVKEKNGTKILAVTVLTSFDQADIESLGFPCTIKDLALFRARRALKVGCDGVISSGLEASDLRKELGEKFLIITPGIRPVDNTETDDQKRTVSVKEAFYSGADYVVIGRPIRNAPDPLAKAKEIQAEIASLFSERK